MAPHASSPIGDKPVAKTPHRAKHGPRPPEHRRAYCPIYEPGRACEICDSDIGHIRRGSITCSRRCKSVRYNRNSRERHKIASRERYRRLRDLRPRKQRVIDPLRRCPNYWRLLEILSTADTNECMLWPSPSDRHVAIKRPIGRPEYVHRIALAFKLGRPLMQGMWALHECDAPRCFNPRHLREGTPLDNVTDREARGRTRHSRRWRIQLALEI